MVIFGKIVITFFDRNSPNNKFLVLQTKKTAKSWDTVDMATYYKLGTIMEV